MALKIIKTAELKVTNVVVTIYGSPSSGKTSLGFTAKNPLVLDFDNGSHRAHGLSGNEAVVKCQNWADVQNISKSDLDGFDTLVIDTVGAMTSAIQTQLEQRGMVGFKLFGEVGNTYKSFVNKIKSWGKDLVFIAHFSEEKKGENIVTRLDTVGSVSKNSVYQSSDLLGYLSSEKGVRTLDFDAGDGKIGKNTGNFTAINLTATKTTLAEIIEQLKTKVNEASALAIERNRLYNEAVDLMSLANDVSNLNVLMSNVAISSNNELKFKLVERGKELNVVFDKTQKCFIEPAVEIANDREVEKDNSVVEDELV